MKRVIMMFTCFLALEMQALEYEKQVDNNEYSVSKVKIAPHEEIGLHRDGYAQIVIALKGGTITRIEADGSIEDVEFPTGVAVFRPADPENMLHKSINKSSEPVELMIVQLKAASPVSFMNAQKDTYDVALNIRLNCPTSNELDGFIKSVPPEGSGSVNYEEWKTSFIHNMRQLIHLVESDKVNNSWWCVGVDRVGKDLQPESANK